MARAKRSIESAVNIDGFSLIWRLHREQQWFTADGWKGISIQVKLAGERAHRELYLEFPPVGTERPGNSKDAPAQILIAAAKVEAGIRDAMEGGWDPESRGKPYFFQTDLLPG